MEIKWNPISGSDSNVAMEMLQKAAANRTNAAMGLGATLNNIIGNAIDVANTRDANQRAKNASILQAELDYINSSAKSPEERQAMIAKRFGQGGNIFAGMENWLQNNNPNNRDIYDFDYGKINPLLAESAEAYKRNQIYNLQVEDRLGKVEAFRKMMGNNPRFLQDINMSLDQFNSLSDGAVLALGENYYTYQKSYNDYDAANQVRQLTNQNTVVTTANKEYNSFMENGVKDIFESFKDTAVLGADPEGVKKAFQETISSSTFKDYLLKAYDEGHTPEEAMAIAIDAVSGSFGLGEAGLGAFNQRAKEVLTPAANTLVSSLVRIRQANGGSGNYSEESGGAYGGEWNARKSSTQENFTPAGEELNKAAQEEIDAYTEAKKILALDPLEQGNYTEKEINDARQTVANYEKSAVARLNTAQNLNDQKTKDFAAAGGKVEGISSNGIPAVSPKTPPVNPTNTNVQQRLLTNDRTNKVSGYVGTDGKIPENAIITDRGVYFTISDKPSFQLKVGQAFRYYTVGQDDPIRLNANTTMIKEHPIGGRIVSTLHPDAQPVNIDISWSSIKNIMAISGKLGKQYLPTSTSSNDISDAATLEAFSTSWGGKDFNDKYAAFSDIALSGVDDPSNFNRSALTKSNREGLAGLVKKHMPDSDLVKKLDNWFGGGVAADLNTFADSLEGSPETQYRKVIFALSLLDGLPSTKNSKQVDSVKKNLLNIAKMTDSEFQNYLAGTVSFGMQQTSNYITKEAIKNKKITEQEKNAFIEQQAYFANNGDASALLDILELSGHSDATGLVRKLTNLKTTGNTAASGYDRVLGLVDNPNVTRTLGGQAYYNWLNIDKATQFNSYKELEKAKSTNKDTATANAENTGYDRLKSLVKEYANVLAIDTNTFNEYVIPCIRNTQKQGEDTAGLGTSGEDLHRGTRVNSLTKLKTEYNTAYRTLYKQYPSMSAKDLRNEATYLAIKNYLLSYK